MTTKTQHKFLNSACRSNISPTKSHRLADEILLHFPSDIYQLLINKSKIGLHWTDGQSQQDFQWTPNCLCIYFMFLLLTGHVSYAFHTSAVTNQWCFPAGWMIKVTSIRWLLSSVLKTHLTPQFKWVIFIRPRVKPVCLSSVKCKAMRDMRVSERDVQFWVISLF